MGKMVCVSPPLKNKNQNPTVRNRYTPSRMTRTKRHWVLRGHVGKALGREAGGEGALEPGNQGTREPGNAGGPWGCDRPGSHGSLRASRGNQPGRHLQTGLLASRAGRQHVPVVLAAPPGLWSFVSADAVDTETPRSPEAGKMHVGPSPLRSTRWPCVWRNRGRLSETRKRGQQGPGGWPWVSGWRGLARAPPWAPRYLVSHISVPYPTEASLKWFLFPATEKRSN